MPFEKKSVELSRGTLIYHVGGNGKPVLHLHSAGGVTISKPLEAIATQHQVFLPVCPGFDGTPGRDDLRSVGDYADLVAEFAERVIGSRFDLIGQSFGSWTALRLTVAHPEMVENLILGVPAGFRFDGKGGLPADPDERFKALYAHPEKLSGTKPQDVMAGNAAVYARLAGDVLVDEELAAKLPEIEAVTLILQGTEDTVVPTEAGAFLKQRIPASQRVFIYDAAHSIEIDQPEKVARVWTEFLSRGPGFVLNRGAEAGQPVQHR